MHCVHTVREPAAGCEVLTTGLTTRCVAVPGSAAGSLDERLAENPPHAVFLLPFREIDSADARRLALDSPLTGPLPALCCVRPRRVHDDRHGCADPHEIWTGGELFREVVPLGVAAE